MSHGFWPGGRLASLPVHHGGAAVGVGEYRVDAPAHHGAADGHLERHLDVNRRAGGPRRREEGVLQRGQLLGIALRGVGVRGAGQVVEVEQPLGAVEPLHPVVKCVAQQGMRVRAGRQPAHQPLRGVPWFAGQAPPGC